MFVSWLNKFDWRSTRDYAEICQVLSEQFHSQYLSGCKSIFVMVVVLEHFKTFKPTTIPMTKLYSRLFDEIGQDASTTVTHLRILLQYLVTKQMIYPFLTTMWGHTYGCTKQYQCVSDIYLL